MSCKGQIKHPNNYNTMRRARIRSPIQIGARLAVGILAAVWLWNLKIVSENIGLHESLSFFPSLQGTSCTQSDPAIDGDERIREKEVRITAGNVKGRVESNDSSTPSSDDEPSIAIANNFTLPPPEHRVPNFIIIGAQKSATQALRTYLQQHPLVRFPSKIEPHFFDWGYRSNLSDTDNLDAYMTLLNGKHNKDCRRRNCITGESTPSYLFATKQVPKRIKQLTPWAKFLVVLRDPVKRAFSQCNMLIEKHEVKTSFREHYEFDLNWMKQVGLASDKALTRKEEDAAWNRYHKHKRYRKMMLGRGLYEIQLRKWFEYFPREQFLILKSEELDHNRSATMTRVYEFLGLPENELENDKKVHTKKYKATMSNETRKELYDFYRPYNQRLEGLLGSEWKGIWEEPS